MYLVRAGLLFCALTVLATAPIQAAQLPKIKASDTNTADACVTPGRMMAFLKTRNRSLPSRFETIASHYMRHGEAMNLRWDIAFFQMLVETNYLTFKRGDGSSGDVKQHQNNFAGLGATGGGVPGDKFKTVSDGVKAHLQHVAMYAGENIDNPISSRTRKVQSWGVLNKWRRSIRGPMTFTHLTRKWSPGDSGYSDDIHVVRQRFMSNHCNKPDPAPELLAAIGAENDKPARTARATAKAYDDRPSGADLARQAIERGKAQEVKSASGLGIGSMPFTLLNGAKSKDEAPATKTAMAGAGTRGLPKGATPKANPSTGKCHVFTASYGGQKAVIIKARKDGMDNYTVLDVNQGREARETDAYIAAYAKGGTKVAEFFNPNEALDRAFELCPEG